jgi:hypothetical protein
MNPQPVDGRRVRGAVGAGVLGTLLEMPSAVVVAVVGVGTVTALVVVAGTVLDGSVVVVALGTVTVVVGFGTVVVVGRTVVLLLGGTLLGTLELPGTLVTVLLVLLGTLVELDCGTVPHAAPTVTVTSVARAPMPG